MTLTDVEQAKLVYKAKLAEQAERFNEMRNFLRQVVRETKELKEEEQKLFSVAYKNYVSQMRVAWNVANSTRSNLKGKDPVKEGYSGVYADEISTKILQICKEMEEDLAIVRQRKSNDVSSDAFYCKLDADYKRYRAEMDKREMANASDAYKHAMVVAAKLPANNATRMGIALNYAVYKHDMENDSTSARSIAQEALTAAGSNTGGDRDAFVILQLLKDNIDFWSTQNKTQDPLPI